MASGFCVGSRKLEQGSQAVSALFLSEIYWGDGGEENYAGQAAPSNQGELQG